MFLQVCPVCEHRNPRGSRFCNECGSPLQLRFCPHCHAAEDVMALECRACGARLPLLSVTDPTSTADTLPPAPDTLWSTRAPEPAPFEPTLGGLPVDFARLPASARVPADPLPELVATAPPRERIAATEAMGAAQVSALGLAVATEHDSHVPGSTAVVEDPQTPLQALAAEAKALVPQPDPPPALQPERPVASEPAAGATKAPQVRSPSIIERLSAARPAFEFLAQSPAPAADGGAKPDPQPDLSPAPDASPPIGTIPQPVVLGQTAPIELPAPPGDAGSTVADVPDATEPVALPLAESEIAVSNEAETLVEASVVPVRNEPPVGITIADTRVDDIAAQFRGDAWRHAVPGDPAPLAPAVIHLEPPPNRRLSMRRVGLVVGSVGAIAAALLFIRFHSSPTPAATPDDASTQAAAPQKQPVPQPPPASPQQPPLQTAVPAEGSTDADTTSAARQTAAATSKTTPPVPADTPPDNAQAVVANPPPAAPADPVVSAGKAAATDAKAAAQATRRAPVARTNPDATAPIGARRAAVETPRACTPAVAALGLCTLDSPQKGN